MPQLESYKNGYYLWNYVPSVPGAVIFTLLFFITTFLHCWRMFKSRAWFCIPFAIGCFFEAIGYAGRASAANKTGKLMPYIIQNFFILVSPALFAASIYMTLGRIMRSVKGEHYSVVRITWLTKTFVLGDVLSFMVQGGSAGLMFNSNTVKLGEDVVLAGLFIQIVSFGFFFLSAVIFQRRMRNRPTRESSMVEPSWEQNLFMLHTVSILILVRSIFRVVEYIQGQSGYSLKHEWTLYIFDSVPMLIVTIVFFLRHPGSIEPAAVESVEEVNIQMDAQHKEVNQRVLFEN